MFVFNREYVASGGKGYLVGDTVGKDEFTEEITANLVKSGILTEVITKEQFFEAEETDEVAALDPERRVRKRGK